MKVRRLFALLLALLLATAPVVNVAATEETPTETPEVAENQSVAAVDTSLVLWSAAVKHTEGYNYVERGSTDGLYADDPRIDTLLTIADGEFNKSGEEWPWIATKVSVPANGTYTLGVTTNSCKWDNFKLPMVVDGNVYTLTYTAKAQTQTADVSLSAGEHTVIVFWPMPADESEVYVDADWNSYLWANIASLDVDSELTVSLPTTSEVEDVFKFDQTISATDASLVLRSAAVNYTEGNNFVERGATGGLYGDDPRIDTLLASANGEFNKSGEEWPWIAYNVSVPTDGTYTLGVTTNSAKWDNFKLPMVVDGNVYTLAYTAKAQTQTVEVSLPAGEHTVIVFWPMPANESEVYVDADWNSYQWCNIAALEVDYYLSVSLPETAEVEDCFDNVISAVNTDYLLHSTNMVVNDTKLGCTSQGNVRYDAPLVDNLYYNANGQFNKSGEEWNWFAYKVTVPADGTYTLGVETAGCNNTSYTIPLCVNGDAYALAYSAKAQKVSAEVSLSAGEHVVTIFSPMPANAGAVTGTANVDYPWCDFINVIVDNDLTVSKPEAAEVEACFAPPANTVIPAVDTDYILLSRNMQINDTKLSCINQGNIRYDVPMIDNLYVKAYQQFNNYGEEWNWFAYKITVPADGTYILGVETAGCKNASYTIPLCVNGNAYTLAYTANAQQVITKVELPAGEHVVTVFSPMPANAGAVTGTDNVDYPWCDFSNLVVDYRLTVSKPTASEVEACFDHTEEIIPGKAATCAEPGLTEGKKCSDCGLILVPQMEIPATGEHAYEGVVTEPTCTEDGYTTYTCSACGHSYTDDVVAATGEHSYDDGIETKAPSCSEEGEMTYTCSACGNSYTEAIDMLDHSYENGTCTVCGEADPNYAPECEHEYTYACDQRCAKCGELTNPDAAHTVEHVAAVEPGCESEGNIEYWYCTVCGAAWEDEAQTKVTNLKSVILPVAHNVVHVPESCYNVEHWYCEDCEIFWADEALMQITNSKNVIKAEPSHNIEHVAESCYNTEYWYCDICETYWADEALTQITNSKNVIKAEPTHTLVHVEAVEGDCQTMGNIEYWYCEACETVWADEALTQITNMMSVKTGYGEHKYFYACDAYCMNCGELTNEEAAHNMTHVPAKAGTDCQTWDGNIEYWTCSYCNGCWDNENATGMPLTMMSIKVPGDHKYENGVCSVCGEADPDYVEPIVKFDFAGSTMTLGNELVLNFVYNKALLTGTDNYAKVTIAREDGDYTYEIPQSEWTAFNASLNQIPVKVFAKEMTDEVTVVICNAAGQEVSNPRTGSVVAYCNNLFEKSNVQEDKAMAVDMLNYGAAAQIQFNYREETLANAGLTDELKALATVVTDMEDTSVKGPGCAGNTLTLEDKILLNFVYQNATIDKAAYATVSYVDHYDQAVSYNIEAADFLTFNSSMKMVQINTLVVADCRTMVSVELFDADGNSLGVSKNSVESYTARSGQELFKAILAFGDSAYAKFH